eukprot:748637-Hanusia_phi.AAC.2
MLPPEYEEETEHVFDVRAEEEEKQSRFFLARPSLTSFLQRAGDTIFVPSGERAWRFERRPGRGEKK